MRIVIITWQGIAMYSLSGFADGGGQIFVLIKFFLGLVTRAKVEKFDQKILQCNMCFCPVYVKKMFLLGCGSFRQQWCHFSVFFI